MRILLALAASILVSGCSSLKNDEIARVINRKEIKVGVEADFKPLIFKDENKKLLGIEPELARRAGKIAGAKIIFYEYPWDSLIPALEAGKIDVIMSGMTITEERMKKVDFTAPYVKVGQMALIRNTDAGEFSSTEKIRSTSKRIGYIQGTTGDFFVNSKCTKAAKFPFKQPSDGIKSLSERKIDVFVIDAPVVWELSNPNLTALLEPLTDENLGWAVRKNDKPLLDGLNMCLREMKKDGTLELIRKKWIPQLLLN